MSARIIAGVLLGVGLVRLTGVSGIAAEPNGNKGSRTPTFSFSTLRSMPEELARTQVMEWLRSVGRFDAARLEHIWQDTSRSLIDRTADGLALGLPEAQAALQQVRNPEAPAPDSVPTFLKDSRLDPFVRTNLALAFAKAAANRKAYEEALEALNGGVVEKAVDPAAFLFYKAVCEHATMQKNAATRSILRLLEEVVDAPDRYRLVASLMFFEMQNWSPDPKDLANIERLMDNSGRRLELARAGEKTQDIQRKIIFRLDELIKELENQAKNSSSQCNGGNCPNGGQPNGNRPGSQQNPSSPAPDSVIMGGSGKGIVDEKELRKIAENWGTLPPDKRAKIIEDINRDLPPKYKPIIDEYFKALNRIHGYSK
ncbi:MAG: hypothetical protein NZ703_15185 [Gemmataceae bacterium]|nr:hypothetical protein [Gemmataceae bacterium]MCS7272426.1 hypothetical protein [Gemmataceae bacterium]MDW8241711.1 hypothetical protein [Thermogemmata sp.]